MLLRRIKLKEYLKFKAVNEFEVPVHEALNERKFWVRIVFTRK
jgi:hypothetical protein